MDRYNVVKQIGDGAYGSVMKATHKQTREIVAIKKMKQKFYNWEECVSLREVQALRKLNNHPNIVKLREVIREQNQLFFVFEYMDGDLLSVMKEHAVTGQTGLPQPKIRNIMYQLLQAVAWMHKLGFMHRDLKPENLLLSRDVAKLADFGLAKEIRARPPFTEYVSTRWYRAPEVLLQHKAYNSPIDIWAAGCMMAELYTLRPLFPGSSESDELFKITSVLGTPDSRTWPEGLRLAKLMGFNFPQIVATPIKQLLPNAGPQALNLMNRMMQWDPEARPKAAQLLQHPFFQVSIDGEGPDFLMQQPAVKAPASAPAFNAAQEAQRRENAYVEEQVKPQTTTKNKNTIDITKVPSASSIAGSQPPSAPAGSPGLKYALPISNNNATPSSSNINNNNYNTTSSSTGNNNNNNGRSHVTPPPPKLSSALEKSPSATSGPLGKSDGGGKPPTKSRFGYLSSDSDDEPPKQAERQPSGPLRGSQGNHPSPPGSVGAPRAAKGILAGGVTGTGSDHIMGAGRFSLNPYGTTPPFSGTLTRADSGTSNVSQGSFSTLARVRYLPGTVTRSPAKGRRPPMPGILPGIGSVGNLGDAETVASTGLRRPSYAGSAGSGTTRPPSGASPLVDPLSQYTRPTPAQQPFSTGLARPSFSNAPIAKQKPKPGFRGFDLDF